MIINTTVQWETYGRAGKEEADMSICKMPSKQGESKSYKITHLNISQDVSSD